MKHNFAAGPSILPQYTIEQTIDAIKNFAGTGLSIMEISHRGEEFTAVIKEAQALFRELLDIPDNYSILFLGGGASMQFCMVPYNLMREKAAYLCTGSWSEKAINEAKLFGQVIVVASSKDSMFNYVPTDFVIPVDVDYFHFTSNNTIYGTQIRRDFDLNIPVVADMSSDIFSRPIDVSKYGIIYGGAQKNLGTAGVSFVIIRNDLIMRGRKIPTMLNYQTHLNANSIFNTPPVLPIYSALMTLRWLKEQGGIKAIQKINKEKATILYDEIDRNSLFKCRVINKEDRSLMNVCFFMNDGYEALEKDFLEFARTKDILGINGHSSVGGFRASIYNAMPKTSVQVLVECMQEFENHSIIH